MEGTADPNTPLGTELPTIPISTSGSAPQTTPALISSCSCTTSRPATTKECAIIQIKTSSTAIIEGQNVCFLLIEDKEDKDGKGKRNDEHKTMSKHFLKKLSTPIEDTLRGDNRLGKKLNRVLPAKGIREVAGAILLGAKDVIAWPQIGDAKTKRATDEIKGMVQKRNITKKDIKHLDVKTLLNFTYRMYDLVDDGRLNKSADALSPEFKFKIRISSSVIVIVGIVYAVATGEHGLAELLIHFFEP